MDELLEFCARALGDRAAAGPVADAARLQGGDDVMQLLSQAVKQCHALEQEGEGGAGDAAATVTSEATLSAAVAAELTAANRRLPARQREALALRELFGLKHAQLAEVLGIEAAAVAPLLARARLRLRAELRRVPMPGSECKQRDRLLRAATVRHDHEEVSVQEDDWLLDHLGHCDDCIRAHAAMLEGSACYRGWRVENDRLTTKASATP